MTDSKGSRWRAGRFRRHIRGVRSSTDTVEVETDGGRAYVKAMGNRQGPHALACDLVGTQLAQWFGLPVLDWDVMIIGGKDEIRFLRGGQAQPGPAFATRALDAHAWSGHEKDLRSVVNSEVIPRLVVFDTWVLNCDRHPPDTRMRRPNPDNVILTGDRAPKGRLRLVPIDHGHCFTCGRDLDARIASINMRRDERIYGLFPAFGPHMTRDGVLAARAGLNEIDQDVVRDMIGSIPAEWQVPLKAREALLELVCDRAAYLAERIPSLFMLVCGSQKELGLEW